MVKTSTLSSLTAAKNKKEKQSENLSEAFEPSDAVIANLLNYSKALSVKKSKSMGYVENLLN